MSSKHGIVVNFWPAQSKCIAHFRPIHPPASGFKKTSGEIWRRLIFDPFDEVVCQDFRCTIWSKLVQQHRLHNCLGLFRSLPIRSWGPSEVSNISKESDEINNLLLSRIYAHFREAIPHWTAAKERDGMHGIEVIDWGAKFLHREIFRTRVGKLQDSLSDCCMQKSYPDC